VAETNSEIRAQNPNLFRGRLGALDWRQLFGRPALLAIGKILVNDASLRSLIQAARQNRKLQRNPFFIASDNCDIQLFLLSFYSGQDASIPKHSTLSLPSAFCC
jgi:hypothetical protein